VEWALLNSRIILYLHSSGLACQLPGVLERKDLVELAKAFHSYQSELRVFKVEFEKEVAVSPTSTKSQQS
jgi:hypothetical protein